MAPDAQFNPEPNAILRALVTLAYGVQKLAGWFVAATPTGYFVSGGLNWLKTGDWPDRSLLALCDYCVSLEDIPQDGFNQIGYWLMVEIGWWFPLTTLFVAVALVASIFTSPRKAWVKDVENETTNGADSGQRHEESWTTDDSTVASNPGELSVKWYCWIQHYPKWPVAGAFSFVLLAVLGWTIHWSFWILAALLIWLNWLYWTRIKEHFKFGCVNPGIVISMNPMLIAVLTDLSNVSGDNGYNYPVIKVLSKELSSIAGQDPLTGMRLATVALYVRGDDEYATHWEDFDPRPAECATNDINEIKRLMASISHSDWTELDAGLGQIPRPYAPGLYRVDLHKKP